MKTLLAAVTSLSLFTGAVTPAFADHRDHDRQEWRHHQDRDHRDRHDSRRDHRRDRHDRYDGRHYNQRFHARDYRSNYSDGRYDQRRYYEPRYAYAPRYIAPRGYYARSWHRGDRLPAAYCDSRYIVRDYSAYRLYAPPRGHHWVRVDDDVLLTAVATGAVIAVVSGLFH
jgi:Ni/Co efflux regulator RcnB